MDKPILKHDIFLSFYGDDFTGSTDVMESLALNGIPTALFLEAPGRREVEQFQLKVGVGARGGTKQLRAFGVAGIARSLSPAGMDRELPDIFDKLSRIPADFFQYKVCSTFDSAPETGNIGHAAEIALRYFPSDYIPLLIGAPFLNRFLVFGNLFACVGETTYRLDRHPTMSKHPVTPMRESDLRQHLALQTRRPVQLLDLFALEGHYGPVDDVFDQLIAQKGRFLLMDTLTTDHLYAIGRLLVQHKKRDTQLIVGASGADYALAFYLQRTGAIEKPTGAPFPGKAGRMLVAAGSCSPVTAGQIDYMEARGHAGIRLDSLKLIRPGARDQELENAVAAATHALQQGRVPMLYTAKGPDDPAIGQTRRLLLEAGRPAQQTNELLAGALGEIIRQVIAHMGKMRLVVVGGDTSGYVARSLGIYALETLCPIAPGAPLCMAHAKDSRFDGLEIALKGGQNGDEKYFASILEGKPQ